MPAEFSPTVEVRLTTVLLSTSPMAAPKVIVPTTPAGRQISLAGKAALPSVMCTVPLANNCELKGTAS